MNNNNNNNMVIYSIDKTFKIIKKTGDKFHARIKTSYKKARNTYFFYVIINIQTNSLPLVLVANKLVSIHTTESKHQYPEQ